VKMKLSQILFVFAAISIVPAKTFALPGIAISRKDGQVTITFNGALESATQLSGPWLDLTNATNPFTEIPATAQRFYRARESGGVFSSSSILHWTLRGPFQTNFNLAFAGTPDGIFPPKRAKDYFDAHVTMGALELPVTMRIRGNSSLQECPFPKLKLKVSKENRAGTPFAEAREIKIGTHCAEGGRGNIGRLRDERAAWREALAYETMQALGFVSPKVRRTVIEYHDTTAPDQSGNSGWTVLRHAFVAEDIELVADRLGGQALTDEEIAALAPNSFDPQLVVDLELLHGLFGNWDFSLGNTDGRVWNTEVIALAEGTVLPVAGDFDLASWVTETARLSTPREYHPELGEIERQALYTIEGIAARAGAERFAAGRTRFLEHRSEIEANIQVTEIDDAGRSNALRHVAAFYNALQIVTDAGSGKP
jgi:hypothetical protein